MKFVTPELFLVGKTQLTDGLRAYLESIGAEWEPDPEVSDGENLIEAAGRVCYRSWSPYDPSKPEATNPNVTRVRRGNKRYLKNILESGHGSVLEHVQMNFVLKNVSRVLTHELVRHRVGTAFSQESLRYVRLTDLRFVMPMDIEIPVEAEAEFARVLREIEAAQETLANIFRIDELDDFHRKKKLTSAFRRAAPIGLATTVFFSANLRTIRHIIGIRAGFHAEGEIRVFADQLGEIAKKEYPNAFQDMGRNEFGVWTFENAKV